MCFGELLYVRTLCDVYYKVVLLVNKEFGEVKYCTIDWESSVFAISTSRLDMPEGYLTFCEGVILSTGASVMRKNTSNTDKRITNENKWFKKAKNVSFVCSIIVDE